MIVAAVLAIALVLDCYHDTVIQVKFSGFLRSPAVGPGREGSADVTSCSVSVSTFWQSKRESRCPDDMMSGRTDTRASHASRPQSIRSLTPKWGERGIENEEEEGDEYEGNSEKEGENWEQFRQTRRSFGETRRERSGERKEDEDEE